MARPRIFVSYARADGREWLERVERHLAGIGEVEVWTDERIAAGDPLDGAIRAAMDGAVVAVMLLTPGFLASEYIRRKETPHLLDRMRREGLHVVGIWAASCSWKKQVPWLAQHLVKPNKPLARLAGEDADAVDAALMEIADDISDVLARAGGDGGARGGSAGPEWVDVSLPATDSVFLGRADELAALDGAWESRATGLFSVVAFGGEGKSALVNEWLGRMRDAGWRGAARVYGVSFFSQGTREHTVSSADEAILAMLRRFGDPHPTQGTADDRGARLAQLVRQKRTLLVLDGLEPLQRGPGPDEGKLTDPALRALLRNLAMDNPGLCVVTTRVAVADVAQWKEHGAPVLRLPDLGPVDGAELLRIKGVRGTPAQREAVARAFGGHALALHLLGTWLEEAYNGDITRVSEVPLLNDDTAPGKHARRVMDGYAAWLGDTPERRLWWLLGLFDRPVKRALVDALRDPPIAALTDGLTEEVAFNRALSRLRKLGLLWESEGTLDAHPLVRAYAADRMKRDLPAVWQKANSTLFDWLCASTVELPQTLDEMIPLFQAIPHGCAAGRHKAAADMFNIRVQRKDQLIGYSHAPHSMTVACLASFFNGDWSRPHESLRGTVLSFVLNHAGTALLSVGAIRDARVVFELSIRLNAAMEGQGRFATADAANLAAAHCLTGELQAALKYATVVDGQDDAASTVELVYSCAGRYEDARRVRSRLDSVFVMAPPWHERADTARFLEWGLEVVRLVTVPSTMLADANLTVAVAEAGQQLNGSGRRRRRGGPGYATAAVDVLRRTGNLPRLAVSLITRAALHRFAGDLRAARVDLDEAFDLAERCGMRLHLADAHLEYARLALAEKTPASARDHLARAKALIDDCGYRRRDRDVKQLERQLAQAQGQP